MSELIDRIAEESEKITDSGRIVRLLKQMAKHYCPLTVKISDHKTVYTSCIISIDSPYVLLDELIPPSGQTAMSQGCTVQVRGKLEGVNVLFSTQLERIENKDKLTTYYLNLPKTFYYQQRRQSYRVRIPMAHQLHALVDVGHDAVVTSEIRDISHGGIGNIIHDDKVVLNNRQYYECCVQLPDEEWLYCSIEICHIRKVESRKTQLFGARFVDLSRMQKRLLSSCITVFEQEEIRKRKMV